MVGWVVGMGGTHSKNSLLTVVGDGGQVPKCQGKCGGGGSVVLSMLVPGVSVVVWLVLVSGMVFVVDVVLVLVVGNANVGVVGLDLLAVVVVVVLVLVVVVRW